MAEIDPRVAARYESNGFSEADRLFKPGFGELTRLRTWDLFDRLLPAPPAVVIDVGGGPGVHAAHLAHRGYEVRLFDPVERHLVQAEARAREEGVAFAVQRGEARALPLPAGCADVVLLMGPLYHLPSLDDRLDALREARRLLRPGGVLLAEVISRFGWLLDRTHDDDLEDPDMWRDFEENIGTGMSAPPDLLGDEGFYAYFHRPEAALAEVKDGGFDSPRAFAVESFAANLHDLEDRLARDAPSVLRAVRLIENEPSLLGASPHVLIAAPT